MNCKSLQGKNHTLFQRENKLTISREAPLSLTNSIIMYADRLEQSHWPKPGHMSINNKTYCRASYVTWDELPTQLSLMHS